MDERRAGLALHIASGLHQGGRVRIQENSKYRIGAAVDGDIVVRDPGMAACHVTLEVSEGRVRLEALADAVLIDGLRKLPPGHIAESRLPCRFSMGEVQVYLGDEHAAVPGAPSTRRALWLQHVSTYPAIWVCLLLAILAIGLLIPQAGGQKGLSMTGRHEAAQAVVSVPPAQEVRQALEAQLHALGLQGTAVSVDGRLIEVRGALPAHLKTQWLDAQAWFDRRYGSHYVLKSALQDMEPPQVSIMAVWLGERPYLIDADGERHYQGAILKEGWLLQSIDEGRIVLARNGQEHVFAL